MCGIFGGLGLGKREARALGKSLKNRGPDSFGLLKLGNATIGQARLAIVGRKNAKPPFFSRKETIALVHNGEWYAFPEDLSGKTGTDSEAIANLLEAEGLKGLSKVDGPFSLAWISKDGSIYTARDSLGIKPLFWGLKAFASERKALMKMGVPWEEIRSQPPGTVYRNGVFLRKLPEIKPTRTASGEIPALVSKAVEKRAKGIGKITVAFSGGVDSSIVAKLASNWAQVNFATVGIPGSPDFERAEKAAELLNLPKPKKIEFKLTTRLVSEVSRAIETSNPMQIQIAIPLYVLAKKTKNKVILTGQGADELFLGYKRYYSTPKDRAKADSIADVLSIGERNCERDDLAVGAFGKELRQPFLDRSLIEASLGIPFSEKASDKENRKIILRKAAIELGLPREIAFAPKKAVQHSTGVSREFAKIGKNQ